MSIDNEPEDGEFDHELRSRPSTQGRRDLDGWDGSRRSWTGDPEDGSWIEKTSDSPYSVLIRTPDHMHKPQPEPQPAPERVGYKHPPKQHRFQPGQSGNPKGRPVGSKNKPKPAIFDDRFSLIILEEYYREVTVSLGGEMVTLPIARLGMRAIMARAAKGHVAAMKFATELASRIEAQRAQDQLENFKELVLLKQELTAELERRKHIDCTGLPPVLPHPDDIHINLRQVTAEVRGPWTVEERDATEKTIAWLTLMDEGLAQLRASHEVETDPEQRGMLKRGIEAIEAKVEETRSQMPDWLLERVKPKEEE